MASHKTADALEILEQALSKRSPKTRERIELEYLNALVAQLIYEARTKAGLTQAELAKRVGTSQPVIARLENASYRGHSLSMLQRIASAVDKRVDVRLVSTSSKRSRAA